MIKCFSANSFFAGVNQRSQPYQTSKMKLFAKIVLKKIHLRCFAGF